MASRVEELPIVRGLFLHDADGNLLANSLASVRVGSNNSDREYFQHHRASPSLGVYVGPPIHSKSDGSWIFTISRRIDDLDGRFAGIVLATVSIDHLNKFYETFDVGAQGVVSLANADGLLIARKNANQPAIGTDLSNGQIFREFLPRSPIGSFKYLSTFEKVERLGSYRRVEDYPLVVVVAHGFHEVLADWRVDAITHTAISVGLAASLGFLGIRFARQIRSRHEAERRYRLLADNSSDAIACTSIMGRQLYVSPAFSTLTGWSAEEVLGRDWRDYVHPEDQEIVNDVCRRCCDGEYSLSAIYRYICKSGSHLWIEARFRVVPVTTGEEAQFVINIRDITVRKAAEEQLAAAHLQLAVQANTDSLTGLANRRRFDEVLNQEWQRAAREEQPLSLLLIDVDRFKLYNDRYGHQQGDCCLRAVAAAITQSAQRPGDFVARYGGEEIVVLLPGTDLDGATRVAETVRAAIEAVDLEHEGNSPQRIVTASVGVATMLPLNDTEACGTQALVAAADAALYEAKRTGRNHVVTAGEMPTSAAAPMRDDEQQRLDVLDRYEEAGAATASDSLDRVARLTAALFQVPTALISLVGKDRQFFVGRVGMEASSLSRDVSFCAHAITGDGVFIVADATRDQRFADNPLVTGELGIRFYAGAPLLSPLGHPLGSLCIIDRVPRPPLTSSERVLLADLAALAVSHMDQRRLNFLQC